VFGKRLELKIPPLLYAFVYALLMKGICLWLPQYSIELPFARFFAPLLAGLGLSIAVAGAQAVRKANTTIDPRYPESTTELVDSGIYGVTRNPIYVGMLMVLAAWAVHLQNVFAFVMVVVFVATVTQFQIRPEERILEETFGEAYIDYRRRVPRWLFRLTEEDLEL
jgi:protein-S-isoprenylcysteine O-methyltransferase Ste14